MDKVRLFIGVAISMVSLALALRGVHFGEVADALGQANYPLLLLAAATLPFTLWARTLRWKLLFYPMTHLRLSKLFSVLNIGYLISNAFPFRLGDVARAYLIGELEGVSKARALSTIVVERLLDTLTVVLFLVLLLPLLEVPEWIMRPGIAAGVGFLGLGVFLYALSYQQERAVSLFGALSRFLPGAWQERLSGGFGSLVGGFEIVRQRPVALPILSWSVFIWGSTALLNYLVMLAFDLRLPFTAAVLLLCVTTLGMVVPSSPGYVGVFHYLSVLSLSFFSVDQALALSYALVLHALIYITLVLAGVVSLWRESYSYQDIRAIKAKTLLGD